MGARVCLYVYVRSFVGGLGELNQYFKFIL